MLEARYGERRSEAYLRALLISLDPSLVPNEDPTVPPAWNRPSTRTIIISFLYASLSLSLFTGCLAVLGKLLLIRYFRYTDGWTIERRGGRKRRRESLEK